VDAAVLTGDTVLGSGTTVVAHPDGVLADYLRSLEALAALTAVCLLPGHGPVRADAADVVASYVAHRRQRLAEVRAAVAAGARTAEDVVALVYADVDPGVHDAAVLSVRAQLAFLRPRASPAGPLPPAPRCGTLAPTRGGPVDDTAHDVVLGAPLFMALDEEAAAALRASMTDVHLVRGETVFLRATRATVCTS
jgi:hypothetical protein